MRDRLNSASSFLIIFIEVPLLLRICPTSGKFDDFVRKISTNYMRAAAYCTMAVIQFLSLLRGPTSLVAAAVFLSITAICYVKTWMEARLLVELALRK